MDAAFYTSQDSCKPFFKHYLSEDIEPAHVDKKSNQRRDSWIEQQLEKLTEHFTIDIACFTVLANNCHVILYSRQEQDLPLPMQDVITRWHHYFNGSQLSWRYIQGEALNETERLSLETTAKIWRQRLADSRWFIQIVNEEMDMNRQDNRLTQQHFIHAPLNCYPTYN